VRAKGHRSFRSRRSAERHPPMDERIVLCSASIMQRRECM
jgi:hypothetical protein